MKNLLIVIFFCLGQIALTATANEETPMTYKPVTEIIIFKVSDPIKGIKAARAIVEDAKVFNNAILSSKIYQSTSDPHTIAQRITWKSLKEAKEAFAASETFPSMGEAMKLISKHILFDYFYEEKDFIDIGDA